MRLACDPRFQPRDWYFYTYRTTVIEAGMESEAARRLVDFRFRGVAQDYDWWLARPYWAEKYGVKESPATGPSVAQPVIKTAEIEVEEEPAYTIDNIVSEGCFVSRQELEDILGRWRSKKISCFRTSCVDGGRTAKGISPLWMVFRCRRSRSRRR